ncbi:MAG: GNAT family N-acetyltransferase [Burkholderiales bacterium]|nr:GNAT family N-acetyltransferase [Burkholderiales bacterium]
MNHYLAPRIVETARLQLRPFRLPDHEDFTRIRADPDVTRYLGTGDASTPDLSWRVMMGLLGHWELVGYGVWAVTLKDGTLVGQCGFIDVYGWPGFELMWMLGKDYWGHGYAKEAASAALDIAYGPMKRERVISLIRPGNDRSVRLAEALGARREGTVDLLGSPADLFVHRNPASV